MKEKLTMVMAVIFGLLITIGIVWGIYYVKLWFYKTLLGVIFK